MDWVSIGLSVVLGALVQTSIIVMLYNHYIIPHIIKGVKDELMTSIQGWVDEMTAALGQKIADEINDKMLSLKRTIAGKRGRNSQLFAAAQSYLSENLSDDMSDDAKEDIITEAVATYSKPIVDAVLDKIFSKKTAAAQQDNNDAAAAGWC